MYAIEVDGVSGWLRVNTCRTRRDAILSMQHYAVELERDTRIVRYHPTLKIIMTISWAALADEAEAAA